MSTLVSICLVNYNYEKFIKEALESALAQTYTNFELIICDNASTDSSVNIIKSYDDPRIRLYQNDINIPLYQNINNAVKKARGDIITVLHSDDKYHQDFLQEIVNAQIENPDKKVFVTGVNFWHSDEGRSIPCHPFSTGGIKHQHELIIRLITGNIIGNGVNVAFHKDCTLGNELYSSKYKYSADYDLWLRLAEEHEFVYIHKILANYRIHGSNLSHTVNKNLDMVKESVSIALNSLKTSKILSPEIKSNLNEIQENLFIMRAFSLGTSYKSGKLSRNMLNYLPEICPKIKKNPLWHISYLLTYLLAVNISHKAFKLGALMGRIALFPYRSNIRRYVEKLINDIENGLSLQSYKT